ncbi:MAG: type II toxin-antitoxin system PemK/MazF family toxin [Acidobacteria bacterium]|nr:MAG: type II toxin-antitoxin system PemK/MazF family toxin [Acidobacteriota bacterium]
MRVQKPLGWYPKRGEVYLVQMDKPRPAVVVSVDSVNKFALDVCVVPLTTAQHREFSMRVPVAAGEGGLQYDGWAKCDQVTTLEKTYFHYPPLGALPPRTFGRIQEQVKVALGLL